MTKRPGPLVSRAVMLQWRLPTSPLLAPAEGPMGCFSGQFYQVGCGSSHTLFLASPWPPFSSPHPVRVEGPTGSPQVSLALGACFSLCQTEL